MYDSKLTSKGQITVPKVVRERLCLSPGDRVRFVVRDDGTVTVEAESIDLRSLRGAFKATRSVTLEQMEQAIQRGATGDIER